MYFLKQYQEDLETYKNIAQSECVCGRVIDDLIKNSNADFHNLKLFFIYTFYLNLYHELILEDFSDLLEPWTTNIPKHVDYDCTYNQNIISWHRFLKGKKYQNQLLTVTGKDYINEGKEFISFLKTIPEIDKEVENIHQSIINEEKYHSVIHQLINQLTRK
jgi:hypothetical protein